MLYSGVVFAFPALSALAPALEVDPLVAECMDAALDPYGQGLADSSRGMLAREARKSSEEMALEALLDQAPSPAVAEEGAPAADEEEAAAGEAAIAADEAAAAEAEEAAVDDGVDEDSFVEEVSVMAAFAAGFAGAATAAAATAGEALAAADLATAAGFAATGASSMRLPSSGVRSSMSTFFFC